MKYTKDVLEVAVRGSISVSEVIRKLGLRWSGGTQNHIVSRLKYFGISTSHFLGQAANRGKPSGKRRTPDSILVRRRHGRREATHRLKRALLEAGVPYRCNVFGCGIEGRWNGKVLVLQINHINGNNIDDRKENLEFLCPNCHSQTETYGSKNRFADVAQQVEATALEAVK